MKYDIVLKILLGLNVHKTVERTTVLVCRMPHRQDMERIFRGSQAKSIQAISPVIAYFPLHFLYGILHTSLASEIIAFFLYRTYEMLRISSQSDRPALEGVEVFDELCLPNQKPQSPVLLFSPHPTLPWRRLSPLWLHVASEECFEVWLLRGQGT